MGDLFPFSWLGKTVLLVQEEGKGSRRFLYRKKVKGALEQVLQPSHAQKPFMLQFFGGNIQAFQVAALYSVPPMSGSALLVAPAWS